MHNVEYHVSKYTQIINQLKNEVSNLKLQLESKSGHPRSSLPAITEKGSNLAENIEVYQHELANHFSEETATKKRIEELEQKTELCKLSIANIRSSITQSVKENGRDHPSTLDLSNELENLYKNEKQFKAQCETKKQLMSNLKMKREEFQKKWEEAGLSSVGVKMLELQMKQHIMIIDNIDKENETNKATLQLKAREQVLQTMQEQIRIRDNLLHLAEKHFVDNQVDIHLDDPKLVNIEEIIKINSSLPPIASSNSYQIKGNSNFHRNNAYGGVPKAKYRPRLAGNASLPPVASNNDTDDNRGYVSNKYSNRGLNLNPYGVGSYRGKYRGKNAASIARNGRHNKANLPSRKLLSLLHKANCLFS